MTDWWTGLTEAQSVLRDQMQQLELFDWRVILRTLLACLLLVGLIDWWQQRRLK